MKKGLLIGVALVLGLGIVWLYRFLFPPDEVLIRRVLEQAAAAASIQPQESAFDKLGAVNRLLNLCTADIEVVLDLPGDRRHSLQGRDQLREAALALRGASDAVEIKLWDIGVEVQGDRSSATAQFLARARLSQESDEWIQEFKVGLKRAEGSWKIRRVEPLSSLGM